LSGRGVGALSSQKFLLCRRALLVATAPHYANILGAEGPDTLVLLMLDLQHSLQHSGYLVAQIFFGLWLFPLGILAYRSRMFPRPLGVVLMLGSSFTCSTSSCSSSRPKSPTRSTLLSSAWWPSARSDG
jgi:hypothetical protein